MGTERHRVHIDEWLRRASAVERLNRGHAEEKQDNDREAAQRRGNGCPEDTLRGGFLG